MTCQFDLFVTVTSTSIFGHDRNFDIQFQHKTAIPVSLQVILFNLYHSLG